MNEQQTDPNEPSWTRSCIGLVLLLVVVAFILIVSPIAMGVWSMFLIFVVTMTAPGILCRHESRDKPQFTFHYHGTKTVVIDEISDEFLQRRHSSH